MINMEYVTAKLHEHYPDLENVGDGIFRGVDRFGTRDYAIRYFDLNDRLVTTANTLKSYQEEVLSKMYFSSDVATDLRWSHYLYFITSEDEFQKHEFGHLKARVEADREYARKQVIREGEIESLLANALAPEPNRAMPVDLATTWSKTLDQQQLGFILDSDITVPDAVRRIVAGTKDAVTRPISTTALLAAEKVAANHFIDMLTINGFRPHPEVKEHQLGQVNLIIGSNGVGKTSLFEAIEFAYCGRNRRLSPVPNGTSIELSFLGTQEKLTSTTDATRLRARHSNWYAKTEVRTVTIQDSFGKFNFLDTDAAVNLSVTASSDQIGADVTRLVLGAAAENLADRLRRVLKQLQDELKDLRRNKAANEQLRVAAQGRLETIKASPKLSDSLFLELLASTSAIGWIEPPSEKSQLDTLRMNLQDAISSIALIQFSSIDILHSSTDGISLLLTNLNEAANKAVKLDDRARASRATHSNAFRESQTASASILAIEALLPYASTGFTKLVEQASEYYDRVRAKSTKLNLITNRVDVSVIQQFLEKPITNAITSIRAEIETHQERLDVAQHSLQAIEATQSAITVLRQRLLATAQEILQRTSNPDHCPLCRTEFENGQLLARMMGDVQSGTSEQVSLIQVEISAESEALVTSKAKLEMLQHINEFIGEPAHDFSVSQALQYIEQERMAFDLDQSRLDAIQLQIHQLTIDGLSSHDLSSKLLASGLTELPSFEDLQRNKANYKEVLKASQSTVDLASQESAEVARECDALAQRLSIEAMGSTEDLVKTIRKLISDVETAVRARQSLASILTIGDNKTAEEITVNLSAIQQLLVQVSTTNSQEENDAKSFSKEVIMLGELTKQIEDQETKIRRGSEVEQLLNTLAEQSTGGELVNQILAENATEIARIFSRIHMPNEFEINAVNGALCINRRSTGAEVQLSHMSTGQRAAFALSLFLAMNGRLQSGPPILLFDDPVAHIDDINMLSFLDHLRSLAIDGTRQIFFATADNKLAGLFRHKFRFLGEEFKELRLSRSS